MLGSVASARLVKCMSESGIMSGSMRVMVELLSAMSTRLVKPDASVSCLVSNSACKPRPSNHSPASSSAS